MKAIWLYRHQKEVADLPSDFQKNLFDQGKEVGALAIKMFPNGIMIDADHTQGELAIQTTQQAMKSHPEAIFEGGFQFENVLVRVDILKNNFDGTWDLIEVKSTNDVEPKAHYDDVAIQKWVLTNCGIKLRSCNLMHLNREYSFENSLDMNSLFVIKPLDGLIAANLAEIEGFLPAIQATLNLSSTPLEDIGSRCNNPYPCEFTTYCWSHVGPDSIHTLGRISDSKRGELLEKSIERISEIPTEFKLTANQAVEAKAHRENDVQIALREIQGHLEKLKYPLYFLDYESVAYAVPRYNGNWPHKQLTTQYSLHILDKPDGDLIHKEFIHDEASNPSRKFAEHLVRDIKDDGGSIIVYHLTYERERTKELAEEIPELSHSLDILIDRMWDLEIPFAKRWYWDHRFEGSSSIKNVLPVFKPEFSYDKLAIKKGDQAVLEYSKMVALAPGSTEREAIKRALLEYCKMDSLAMFHILMELQSQIGFPKRQQVG
ncbi:hypothetical protein AZI86_05230 [Bdellovibrio bacteriovorus]|uniref:DUF2779 domain-containing protein n=1 Tax=Bdellovibrio bacteriovorus TaxID=959 RepID=A0A150WQ75_BDEBC|nr:DUF2779 domain-containing protein [Bdellovibrio bacteriovorus]KYG66449.1 hypothetical protein AZI86_05230 [Bdellovibrio bacteriovorus]